MKDFQDFLEMIKEKSDPPELSPEKQLVNKIFFSRVKGKPLFWSEWENKNDWFMPLDLNKDNFRMMGLLYVQKENEYHSHVFIVSNGFDMDTRGARWALKENVDIPEIKVKLSSNKYLIVGIPNKLFVTGTEMPVEETIELVKNICEVLKVSTGKEYKLLEPSSIFSTLLKRSVLSEQSRKN